MSDDPVNATAKAAEEIAKTAGKGIDAFRTSGIGEWRATDIVNDLSPAIITTIRRRIQTC